MVVKLDAVLEGVDRPAVLPSNRVLVPGAVIERPERLPHEVEGTVGPVEEQTPVSLQSLPHGPDPVHVGVVQEEHRVEGGVVDAAHGVLSPTAQEGVDGVVGHFQLDLEVAEGGLLQG